MENGRDVFAIARMSGGVVSDALESMPSVLGSGMVVYAVVYLVESAGAFWLVPVLGPLSRAAAFVLWLLAVVASGIVIASVAVPVHRLTLGGETSPQGISLFHPRTLRFAWWLIAFELVWVMGLLGVIALAVTSIGLAPIRFGATLVVLGGLIFVTTRLSMVFPGLAMDVPYASAAVRLREAWAISRGRFWAIVGSSIVAFLPLVIAVGVVTLLAGGFSVAVAGAPAGASMLSLAFWIGLISSAVIRVFGAALGAAVLSFNYRFGGGPHAEQTAETFA